MVGAVNGRLEAVTKAAFDGATAVDIALGLVGAMALWLGVMKVAERGGLVELLLAPSDPLLAAFFPVFRPTTRRSVRW